MKYIDAAKAADKIKEAFNISLCDLVDVFAEIPAEDVQPVEHSRWIPMGDGTYNAFCENCGMERGSKAWNKDDFKYCFCCGAKMDKE